MPITYPSTCIEDQVDNFFGVEVRDPYRWLEADIREDQRVAEWVNAQYEVSFAYLKSLRGRDAIEARLRALWDFEKYSLPEKRDARSFYMRNNGLQNQSV